jgi:hypothetical protein
MHLHVEHVCHPVQRVRVGMGIPQLSDQGCPHARTPPSPVLMVLPSIMLAAVLHVVHPHR